uniref:Retrotransposon Gag domain, retroviral aspartyl protease n=1 Tax=Tanacetum cinerariifolium TaxID=118510 RepID=A0A6L2K069_TANCI|nr:retrotransposon Gag domain, retroviral aspartyl protease [Tanacetum cinerariifolium]
MAPATRNSTNQTDLDPIAAQLAAIAARLESMETIKEDVAALKSHVEIRGKSHSDNHGENSSRPQHHRPFTKIDFPAYAGGDPRGWILKAEKFFRFYQIPDAEKVDVASMHLEGDALDLFSWLSADQTITLWEELVLAFQKNFGPAEFQNPDEYLCSIKQMGSVQEYRQEFARRSARVSNWPENCLLGVFLNGECYRCGDKYGPGHRCKTGTFKRLKASEEQETTINPTASEEESGDQEGFAEISLHAIFGKTNVTTMKLRGTIGTTEVLMLVDGGSTHNFISDTLVRELKMVTEFITPFDLVLGVQWLATLNTEMFMIFTLDGKKYKLQSISSGPQKSASFQHLAIDTNTTPVIPNQLQPLIDKYQGIFHEPTTLPPFHSTSHSIPLLPNSTPPNIRPYRYPHSQKTEIEKQVDELLTAGFIQPSTSPFSSPVLLVKKKDNTWRMCVDYRALNKITVADKYPILNIDELLDELYGATVPNLICDPGISKTWSTCGTRKNHSNPIMARSNFCEGSPRFSGAYGKLKQALMSTPVLRLPDFSKDFTVECDASSKGVGAILSQEDHPVAYFSRHFFIRTYHYTLKFLLEQRITTTEQQQLLLKLMPYDFSIAHRAGKENKGVDALSRRPHSGDFFTSVPYCLEVADIKDGLQDDHYTNNRIDQLISDPTSVSGFFFARQLLLYKQRMVVPDVRDLRRKLVHEAHATPVGGHGAKGVASVFCKEIVHLHGFPRSIISDRDVVFLSNFWQELFRLCQTKPQMSTSYHPQTDGQTELLNRCLEAYLRCFAHEQPTKWCSYLPWAEYSYNTGFHTAAGTTPLFLLFMAGSHLRSLLMLLVKQRMQIWSTNSLRGMICSNFFEVGLVAYKLELPPDARIHPVFHVSMLKPAHGTFPSNPAPPLPITKDREVDLQPNSVLAHRWVIEAGQPILELLILWCHRPAEEATWENYDLLTTQFPDFRLEDKAFYREGSNDTLPLKVYSRRKNQVKSSAEKGQFNSLLKYLFDPFSG